MTRRRIILLSVSILVLVLAIGTVVYLLETHRSSADQNTPVPSQLIKLNQDLSPIIKESITPNSTSINDAATKVFNQCAYLALAEHKKLSVASSHVDAYGHLDGSLETADNEKVTAFAIKCLKDKVSSAIIGDYVAKILLGTTYTSPIPANSKVWPVQKAINGVLSVPINISNLPTGTYSYNASQSGTKVVATPSVSLKLQYKTSAAQGTHTVDVPITFGGNVSMEVGNNAKLGLKVVINGLAVHSQSAAFTWKPSATVNFTATIGSAPKQTTTSVTKSQYVDFNDVRGLPTTATSCTPPVLTIQNPPSFIAADSSYDLTLQATNPICSRQLPSGTSRWGVQMVNPNNGLWTDITGVNFWNMTNNATTTTTKTFHLTAPPLPGKYPVTFVLTNPNTSPGDTPDPLAGLSTSALWVQDVSSFSAPDANEKVPSITYAGTVPPSNIDMDTNPKKFTVPILITNNNPVGSNYSDIYDLVVAPPAGWTVTGNSDNLFTRFSGAPFKSIYVEPGVPATTSVTFNIAAPTLVGQVADVYFKAEASPENLAQNLAKKYTVSYIVTNLTNSVPVLKAPIGLTVTPGNANNALRWIAPLGATGYKIYRSTTAGGETTSLATVTTISYNDTSVLNGTKYYYKVTATDATSESAISLSLENSGTPVAPAAACTNTKPTISASQTSLPVKSGDRTTVITNTYTITSPSTAPLTDCATQPLNLSAIFDTSANRFPGTLTSSSIHLTAGNVSGDSSIPVSLPRGGSLTVTATAQLTNSNTTGSLPALPLLKLSVNCGT